MAIALEEFIKTATKEQKNILVKLGSLGSEEQKLADEINKINESMKSGTYSPDGFSMTVCEDADDAAVISISTREKLSNVRNEMKKCMLKAVELGMGDVGIIERNYEHYVGKPIPKSAHKKGVKQ